MRSATLILILALSTALPLAAQPSGGAAPPSPAPVGAATAIRLGELEKTYRDLDADLAPIVQGPMVIEVTSPQHQLVLRTARVTLTPLADGSHRALLELAFRGAGVLFADIDVEGTKSRFEDRLVLPAQSPALSGRVRLASDPRGFLLTVVELPPVFEVAIESEVGGQLVAACRPLALLGLLRVDCDRLDRAFSLLQVPMPGPGETYLVERTQIGPEASSLLDGYLAAHGGAAPGGPADEGPAAGDPSAPPGD